MGAKDPLCNMIVSTWIYNARPSRVRRRLLPAVVEAAGMSRHPNRKSSKQKRRKTKLGIPDLDHSKSAVLDSLRSPESKRGYRHAIDEFIQWYCSEPRLSFSKVVVTRYRIFLESRQLAAGTINGNDSPRYDGLRTRPPTLDCSVRSSPPASEG